MKSQLLKKKWLLFVASLIVLIAVISYWSKDKFIATKPAAITVQVQSVKMASIPTKITAVGTLRAPQDVKISVEAGGYITKVAFADGQIVKKGDLLFQLDDAKEQADLLSMQAAYEEATNKFNRTQNLRQLKYASAQDIDTAHADVQAKLAALKMAQDNASKKAIVAPFDGVVGARTVSTGDFVATGQKLVELVDRSLLKVDYSVPEKYWQQVKLDQPVTVTTTDSSGRAFAGKVVYIAPTIDPQTHTLALQASIPNPDNTLVPGLFVTVMNVTGTNQETILVPEESLVKSPDKVIVYRVMNDKAVATPVKVGNSQSGGNVEIAAGLNMGDVIVIAGQEKLTDGDLVKVAQ